MVQDVDLHDLVLDVVVVEVVVLLKWWCTLQWRCQQGWQRGKDRP